MIYERPQVDFVWQRLIEAIMKQGTKEVCRGYTTLELLNVSTVFPMSKPLLTVSGRNLGYRFACAEAAWILSGDNRVETIKPYSKIIDRFSDDGLFYFGAYGPKISQQMPYILKAFEADINTRQAVVSIWRESPPVSKDIPCTISIQFLIRDGKIHCIDNMRSSDAWLGVPYDWFNFSMLSAYVALCLRELGIADVELGNMYFNAASQHLYLGDDFGYTRTDISRVMNNDTLGKPEFKYADIRLEAFSNHGELVEYLWERAKDDGVAF